MITAFATKSQHALARFRVHESHFVRFLASTAITGFYCRIDSRLRNSRPVARLLTFPRPERSSGVCCTLYHDSRVYIPIEPIGRTWRVQHGHKTDFPTSSQESRANFGTTPFASALRNLRTSVLFSLKPVIRILSAICVRLVCLNLGTVERATWLTCCITQPNLFPE